MLFSDQVSILSTWFKGWNECEQTVALFSLLKKIKKHQAKFLARCLEHGLKDCIELIPVEKQANDAGFIGRLINESEQKQVINILLSHLPLLRPGNDEVKSQYLALLPRVLTFAVERSVCLRESRQLLSYSLIHPAFDNDERSSLTSWMEHLDDRIPDADPENNYVAGDESRRVSDVNQNRLWKDDPDLPRPNTNPQLGGTPTGQHGDNGFSRDIDTEALSPGLVRDKTEMKSHRVDAQKHTSDDTNSSTEYDFTPWLKSLRLHKYKDLFASMTYNEMMELNEEKLTKQKVTKGARDKILLNVKRLQERFEKLKTLERELSSGGSLRNALNELKNMIYTPMTRFDPPEAPEPAASGAAPVATQNLNASPTSSSSPVLSRSTSSTEIQTGDIPSQFSKVMGKACTQLLISKPDKENISLYMQILEKCIQHTAFTAQQKKRLVSWKSQINKMYRSLPRSQQGARNALGPNFSGRRVNNRSLPSFGVRMTSPPPPMLRTANPLAMFSGQVTKMDWNSNSYGGSHTQPPLHSVQLPIDVSRKTASLDTSLVQRPVYPPSQVAESSKGDSAVTTRELDLDSLCHRVAEHALADSDQISTL